MWDTLFLSLHLFSWGQGVARVEVRGQLVEMGGFFLPLCGFQGSSSDHQWQTPVPHEPSHWPKLGFETLLKI